MRLDFQHAANGPADIGIGAGLQCLPRLPMPAIEPSLTFGICCREIDLKLAYSPIE
jgi:hypothetical protein